ncbi:unnamed protein product [Soboliphyme baturini]|uniref:Doublecortin domain-containing protein n=1 Tax=Soboliphyme baturini TaxID=241478 RepID=A0A183IIA7_9BILA|nr:unnamed protein product [Soboliphyme baturini]
MQCASSIDYNRPHCSAIRVPVSKAKYRNMGALLDELSGKVPLYFGVRKVFTPSGHTEVRSIDQLENQGRLVHLITGGENIWAQV